MNGQHVDSLGFSVDCISDSEIAAADSSTVYSSRICSPYPKALSLDLDKFPMISGGRTWHGFCGGLDPLLV